MSSLPNAPQIILCFTAVCWQAAALLTKLPPPPRNDWEQVCGVQGSPRAYADCFHLDFLDVSQQWFPYLSCCFQVCCLCRQPIAHTGHFIWGRKAVMWGASHVSPSLRWSWFFSLSPSEAEICIFGFSGIKIHPYRQGIPSARPFQRCTGKKINFVSRFSFFSFERNICDWNSFLENSYVLCLSLPWYSVGIVKREQQSFLFQTKPFSFSVCAESVGSSGAAEGDNPFTFGGAGRPATSIKSLKNQPVEPNSALAPPCIPHTTHLSGVNQGRKILTHRIHEDSLFSIVHMGTPHWKVTVFHRLDVSGVCAILFVCYTNK